MVGALRWYVGIGRAEAKMKPGTVQSTYPPPSRSKGTKGRLRLGHDGTGHAGLSFQALSCPRLQVYVWKVPTVPTAGVSQISQLHSTPLRLSPLMDGGGWMMDLLCGREERRRSGGGGETTPKWERQSVVCNLQSSKFNLQSGPSRQVTVPEFKAIFFVSL